MKVVFHAFLALILLTVFFPHHLLAELTEEQQALLDEYRRVGRDDDERAMTAVWDEMMEDEVLVQHILDNEAHLGIHYYSRDSRRIDAANQRRAAANGEIIPFDEVQARAQNPPRHESGPKPVSGDPELADLADPSRKHISDGADPEIKQVVDDAKAGEKKRLAEERERKRIQSMDTAQRKTDSKADAETDDVVTRSRDAEGSTSADAADISTRPRDGPTEGMSADEPLMLPAPEEPKLLPVTDEPKLLPASTGDAGEAIPVGASETTYIDSGDSPLPRSVAPDGGAEIMENSRVIKSPPTDPRQSSRVRESLKTAQKTLKKVGVATEVMEKAGVVADAYLKEEDDAAREGREVSAGKAAGNAAWGVAGGQSYDAGKKIGEVESQAYKRGEESFIEAYAAGASRAVGDQLKSTYHQHSEIYRDEAEEEVRQAQAEGRAANPVRAKLKGAARSAGAMVAADKLLDAAYRDTDADRAAYDTERKLQKKTKAFLEEKLAELDEIAERIKHMTLDENYDPEAEENIITLTKKYSEKYDEILAHDERIRGKKLINPNDPEYIAIKNAYKMRADPMKQIMSEKMLSEAAQLTQSCRFDEASAKLQQVQAGKGRAAAEAAIVTARANEDTVRDMFYRAKEQAGQKNFSGAAVLLRQAAAQSGCAETKAKINKVLSGLTADLKEKERQDSIYENVASLDCTRIKNSRAYWNDEENRALCYCLPGYEWNNAGTACRIQKDILMKHSNCRRIRGSKPVWDAGEEAVYCECPRGEVIRNNVCVEAQSYDESWADDRAYDDPYEDSGHWQGLADMLSGMVKQANQSGYHAQSGSRGMTPQEAIERASARSPYSSQDYPTGPGMFRKSSSNAAGWVRSDAQKPAISSTPRSPSSSARSSGQGQGEFSVSEPAPPPRRQSKPQMIGGYQRGVGAQYTDGWHGADGKIYDSYEEMYRGVKGSDPPR